MSQITIAMNCNANKHVCPLPSIQKSPSIYIDVLGIHVYHVPHTNHIERPIGRQ